MRNRSKPEGSIAQGYLAGECLQFCSLYLADYFESKFNKTSRNKDSNVNIAFGLDIFRVEGHALGKSTATKFDDQTLKRAHQYVLFNCETLRPYIDQHQKIVEQTHSNIARIQIERIHSETFADWFAKCMKQLQMLEEDPISKDLKLLAAGPNFIGVKYDKFVVNGFRFHTRELESKRKTQNSGVTVKAATSSFSSSKDQNPILSELVYYGILTNIIELDYGGGRKVVLFECDWVSKGNRLKQYGDGFTLANFTNVKRHNEPFILASQAEQVFYVEDPIEAGWHVVISTTSRTDYKMQPIADVETYLQSDICNPNANSESEEVSWVHEDIEGIEVETNV